MSYAIAITLAAVGGALGAVGLIVTLWPLLREVGAAVTILRVRRQRDAEALRLSREVARLKARVLAVGPIQTDATGAIHLGDGWRFDNAAGAPEHFVDEHGVYRYLGYTRAEIREIARRPHEFCVPGE